VGFLSGSNGFQGTAVTPAMKQQTGTLRRQAAQKRNIHFSICSLEKKDLSAREFRKYGRMNGRRPRKVATSAGLTREYPQPAPGDYMARYPGIEPTCSSNSELSIRSWRHMPKYISLGKMISVKVERQILWFTSLLTVQG
jgi:hypothetical protein